jgi:hypothetical protein
MTKRRLILELIGAVAVGTILLTMSKKENDNFLSICLVDGK